MWGICSISDISDFYRQEAIISVFVATEFDQSAISWIFKTWNGLNYESGANWHILVPTQAPIHDNRLKATPENFDPSLAREICDLYGLKSKDTPGVVFDNFIDEDRQLFVPMRNFDEAAAKNFFLSGAEVMRKFHFPHHGGPRSLARWRQEVIGEIYNRHQMGRAANNMLKVLPQAASIVRLVRNH